MDKVCQMLNNAKHLNTLELERVSAHLQKMHSRTKGVHDASVQRAEKCRKCGATHIVKFGKDKNGKQRYKCKSCGTTFTETSYSVISRTRFGEDIWEKFIHLTLKGASLAECAFACGISVRTAFIWRHKILAVLRNDQNNRIMAGIIEADETYFPVSYKGNHKKSKRFIMPRKAFKRGTDNRSNKIPKACVMCSIERNGQSYGEVLGSGQLSYMMVTHAFQNRIASDSIVISDQANAYRKYFSEKERIDLVRVRSTADGSRHSKIPEVRGIYHVQTVGNFHNRFRRFLRNYNGVSTKYLNHYVSLFVWIENHKKMEQPLDDSAKTEISKTFTYMSAEKLFDLPPVPKVA